jgi:putative FmdB family regulatory protein
MPTYEYACTSCGEHQEVVQSFRDDALTTCPACGGPLRKVFGSIGVVFKGSGFYKNDSRPAAKESKAAKDTSPSTSSESSGDGSTKEASASAKEKTSSSEGSSGDKSPAAKESSSSSAEKAKKPSGSSAAAS